MAINKQHLEFHVPDLSTGWSTPPGYPEGFKEKILVGELDEENKRGARTRLLKLAPGTYSTVPFVHTYWEEVYLLEGDLIVGNDENGEGGESFLAGAYACRPPGVNHGPFKSVNGCLLLENHYFDPA